ncbi:MAG TPA: hypothetical protein VMX12_00150 [Acidimicrobiia bacterium]|nr:hypothetical protein [Acidimicrobiia bacterium]
MTLTIDRTAKFPLDWNAFAELFHAWKASHGSSLARSSWKWPEKNFLADEILFRGRVGTRNVELSAVTFPDFGSGRSGDRSRFIGITYGTGTGCDAGAIVDTFGELEEELGL